MPTGGDIQPVQRDPHAQQFGQWVTIGSFAAYVAVAWAGTELLAPALGYELAAGIFALLGVFVVIGAMRFGERVEWWMAAKRRRDWHIHPQQLGRFLIDCEQRRAARDHKQDQSNKECCELRPRPGSNPMLQPP